ncbi:hypothetical protein OPAG_02202 [Rhodococcus opacus PD630]|nr:hypothetical protein OPAG_02202 [Rhodococcus opacus PD630]
MSTVDERWRILTAPPLSVDAVPEPGGPSTDLTEMHDANLHFLTHSLLRPLSMPCTPPESS